MQVLSVESWQQRLTDSFGPDIIDIHTVKEKLDISSTKRTWELVLDVLKQLS